MRQILRSSLALPERHRDNRTEAELIDGQRDPCVLADLAKRRMRSKIPELSQALTGRFREHHAFLTRLYLDQYDHLSGAINQLTARVEEAMTPFRPALALLDTIPGVNPAVAEVIVAETGGDMSRFPSAKHLTSWAGLCPGHHESAGRVRSTRIRPGNPYLKGALGMAAFGATRTKDSFLQARYKRLTSRRGPIKALVAVEHSIITAVWQSGLPAAEVHRRMSLSAGMNMLIGASLNSVSG